MNINQKQTILNTIDQILAIDFDLVITKNSQADFESIQFGDYSASDFKYTYIKVFTQLKTELEEGLGLMLPNQEQFYNDFGSVTLDSDIKNFMAYIGSFAHLGHAAEILKRLVYYEIRQGFWDRSKIKQHNPKVEELKRAQVNLVLAEKILSENLVAFTKLKDEYTEKLEEFGEILVSKRSESVEISDIVTQVNKLRDEIESTSEEATAVKGEIDTIKIKMEQKLEVVTKSIDVYEKAFDDIKEECKGLQKDLTITLSDANDNFEKSKTSIDFIDSKKEEIVRLTGMAADGSLGTKFNDRKNELVKNINNFWIWGVFASMVISVGWIYLVFAVFKSGFQIEWINLVINLIKTSPAFVLLGFVFSQYNKERNLQEEYAFKSAVAMTLTAYSNMLEEKDQEGNKSRQDMLIKSIESIYTQPHIHMEKLHNNRKIDARELRESLGALTEMIKNIKS